MQQTVFGSVGPSSPVSMGAPDFVQDTVCVYSAVLAPVRP